MPLWGVERPPLHIAQLAAHLQHHGVRVEVEDLNLRAHRRAREQGLEQLWINGTGESDHPRDIFQALSPALDPHLQRYAEQLLRSDAPVLGFYLCSGNRHFVEQMVRRVRQQDHERMVVVGGPEVLTLALTDQLPYGKGIHFVLGEGEETLLELAQRRLAGGPVGWTPGVVPTQERLPDEQRRLGALSRSRRPPPADLDRIPFPTYDQLSLADYHGPVMPFLFSRGCPGRCAFCADRLHQRRFRCRSGEHAVAELLHHRRRYGRQVFGFNDLSCNGDPARLGDLCRQILRHKLDLVWSSHARICTNLTDDLLRLMASSGCTDLNFGVESGSDAVLHRMGKDHDAAAAADMLYRAERAGIAASINLIVGYPGETEEEFSETLGFVRENQDVIHQVLNLSCVMVKPGTDMAEEPERHGIQLDEEGRWSDRAGVDATDRRRRLEQMVRCLEELKIPLEVINHGGGGHVMQSPRMVDS